MACYKSHVQVDSSDVKSLGMTLAPGLKYYNRGINYCPSALGYQFDSSSSMCYLYGTGLTCSQAATKCRRHGGQLIKVDSSVKNTALNSLMDLISSGGEWSACFGLANRQNEAGPRWTDGSALSGYENWHRTVTSPLPEGCCIYHRKNPSQEFQWNVASCDVIYHYVCEIVINN